MFSYIYCVFNEHCSTHYFFYALRWNKLIFHCSYIFHYSEKYNCYACVSMTLTLFCTQEYLNKRYVMFIKLGTNNAMALLFPVTHENIAFYDHSYNKFLSYTYQHSTNTLYILYLFAGGWAWDLVPDRVGPLLLLLQADGQRSLYHTGWVLSLCTKA